MLLVVEWVGQSGKEEEEEEEEIQDCYHDSLQAQERL